MQDGQNELYRGFSHINIDEMAIKYVVQYIFLELKKAFDYVKQFFGGMVTSRHSFYSLTIM